MFVSPISVNSNVHRHVAQSNLGLRSLAPDRDRPIAMAHVPGWLWTVPAAKCYRYIRYEVIVSGLTKRSTQGRRFRVVNRFKWSVDFIGVRARGAEGAAAPPDSGKTIIFRAKAKFFGQKPAAKNEKKLYNFVFIKWTKTEFIPFSEIKCIGVIYGEYRAELFS